MKGGARLEYSEKEWDKARSLYISGLTYREIAEKTGISYSRLRVVGGKDGWKEARNKYNTATKQKIEEKIDEQAAKNADTIMQPLRVASSQIVEKALELVPTCDKAGDIRALASAIRDMSVVIRDLNDILTAKEKEQLAQAREHLDIERMRAENGAKDDEAVKVSFRIEGDYEGD